MGYDYSSESETESQASRQHSLSAGRNRNGSNDFLKPPASTSSKEARPNEGKGKRRLSDGQRDDQLLKKPAKKTTQTAKPTQAAKTTETTTSETVNIQVSNRYEVLSDQEGDDITEIPQVQTPRANTASASKPPPIILQSVKDFLKLAQNIKLVCVGEPIFQNRGDITRLLTRDSDDHRAATAFLRANGTEFHTYQLNEDRKAQLVIRGLAGSITPDQIKAELVKLKITAETVTQMISTKPDKKVMPLFIVTISKEHASLITDLTVLCYCRISVEKYRNPKGPAQCYHCQKFGHTARYCANAPRCVKCGMKHESKTCKKIYEDPTKCSNCEGNHTANYKGCTYYKNVRDKMNGTRKDQAPRVGPRSFRPSAPPTVNPWVNSTQQQAHSTSARQNFFPPLPQSRLAQPSSLQSQNLPSNNHVNQTQQAVPNMDIQGIIMWAQTLMNALANARQEDTLNIIISHAMPLMLVQSLVNTNNGQP